MSSKINRREFMGISGAGMLGSIAGATPLAQAVTGTHVPASHSTLAVRPNMVLFMPDEMRADALACYGNPITKTPHFDRLASEGTRFVNCHVQFPVCGASRCSMLTGWPTSVRGHRSLFYFLRPEEPNMFRNLRQAGYDVFWFGKNDALAAKCFDDSVTQWADLSSEKADAQSLTADAKSMLYAAGGDRREMRDYKHLELAIKIIERRESTKPFCIFLPLKGPHPPYTVPEDFYNLYSPSSLPPLVPPGLPNKPDFHKGIRQTYGLDKLDDAIFRKIRAVYYGQVTYSDWLLGELMAALDRTGRDKDTALFSLSDHGDYTGDFGLVEKWPSGLEDCLTHIPLFARIPGGKPGVVAEDMVELYDIMQTTLDLAGTTAHHTHFSRTLLPQVTGEAGDPQRAAFAEGGYNIYEPQCFEPGHGAAMYAGKSQLQNEQPVMVSRSAMVRTRTHKLIVRPQGQNELYSYKEDPHETKNLYGDSTAAAVQLALQTKLLHHYINTTGIAPKDKDPRGSPPFSPGSDIPDANWHRDVLDQ